LVILIAIFFYLGLFQLQRYTLFQNNSNIKRKKLGSKSHGLLLFWGEVEVFGHFGDERVDFDIGEFEDSEDIDPIIE